MVALRHRAVAWTRALRAMCEVRRTEAVEGCEMSRNVKWLPRTALRLPPLMLCTSEEEFARALKDFSFEKAEFLSPGDFARTHVFENAFTKSMYCVVCMDLEETKDYSWSDVASCLAHEAVHVKQVLLEEIGEDSPGREEEAYIIQNTVLYLMEEYTKRYEAKYAKRRAK